MPGEDWTLEDTQKLAELRAEIRHLHETLRNFQATVEALTAKIESLERRHNDACRSCTAWTRISALEIAVAEARGTAKGWALGASAVMGALSFLAAWLLRGN